MPGEFGPELCGATEGEQEGAPLSMTVGTRKGPLCRDLSEAQGGNAEPRAQRMESNQAARPQLLCAEGFANRSGSRALSKHRTIGQSDPGTICNLFYIFNFMNCIECTLQHRFSTLQ